ncbi:MAG: cellulase, partial [Acidobacteria bacterium]|nr:cellulase [Acidobacteriota bacterium]
MKLISILSIASGLVLVAENSAAQDWMSLWKSYTASYMDNQVRVIDHDAGDRTTSEGQAYGMFFALVANDRSRFDGLLHWTEMNLAAGDLTARLPAWSWGRDKNNKWGVLDTNSASDADVWMAYTLLAAGKAWNDPHYTTIGTRLAKRIAAEEVAEISGLGTTLLPGAKGFENSGVYRLNASYFPVQLFVHLGRELPDGPWQEIAAHVPAIVRGSSPQGFASDWVEFRSGKGFTPSPVGSYDAIRVYLWAGMLDPGTPDRDQILKAIAGMAHHLRTTPVPPSKVKPDGSVQDATSPAGFSAALLPYLSALGEKDAGDQQMARVRRAFDAKNGLYGTPPKY